MKKVCYVVTIAATIKSFFVPQLKYLAKQGMKVTVICSFDPELQNILGDEIYYIPIEIPRGVSFVGMVKSLKALNILFKKEQFDLVQYSTPNAAFCSAVAAKIAGIRIRNYHLMGLRYLGDSGIKKFALKIFEKITCSLSTSIECVSKSNLQMGISEGLFQTAKATVVWNGSTGGVDLEKFDFTKRANWRREIRAELEINEDEFVFGFVGRITRDKGINEILGAFRGIKKSAKLLLVGNLEGLDTLNQDLLGEAKKSADIIFHENVSDIERYYAAIDILLLPSYREGFGNVIIEAAAMGTPAIVSDIPGPKDAIQENVTALVVPVKDVDSLKTAMENSMLGFTDKSVVCHQYAASHFDSKKLCEKIVARKDELMMKKI